MRSNAKLIAPVAALMVLAGCSSVDPGLGEALRYDMAIQTVNPDPVYPEGGAQPGDNGEQGAEAVKAYRKGQTKPLRIESSTSTTSGGGGGPQ